MKNNKYERCNGKLIDMRCGFLADHNYKCPKCGKSYDRPLLKTDDKGNCIGYDTCNNYIDIKNINYGK